MYRERLVRVGLTTVGLVAVCVVSLSIKSTAQVRPVGFAESRQYKLVFRDEFKGTVLDAKMWNTCYEWYDKQHAGCTNHGNDESEWYVSSNVTVSGGVLILSSNQRATEGSDKSGRPKTYAYASGMISSGRETKHAPAKWQGSYGYYEAKMKIPAGKGLWPAFWLLPTNHQWPPEIDVMEILGDKPNEVLNTYFWKGDAAGTAAKDSTIHRGPNSYADDWHVYGVDWRKNSIAWYIDGQRVKVATGMHVPSEPMQIILNLAVGGNLPGSPDGTTPARARVQVDYVRVFNNKDSAP